MSVLLLNLVFCGIGAGLGAAAGWCLRGSNEGDTTDHQNSEPEVEKESPSIDKVEGLMARLHQMTAAIAADVGEHNTQIQQINEELSATAGDPDGVVNIVEKLIDMNANMSEQLQASEDRLQAQAQEIESRVSEARTDALTTLFNRRGFDDELQNAVTEAHRTGRPVSVMMADVDFFKKFNDTHGHQAGDEVLKAVARTLRNNLADKEIVCRYGGEEFAVVFPGCDIESAKLGAERAREAISREVVQFEGLELSVTASAGLSELRPKETPEKFVKRADQALYASKNAGRNCSYWHDGVENHPVTPGRVPVPVDEPTATESKTTNQDASDETGDLSSRTEFCNDLDRRIGEWRRGGATASVVLMTIDKYGELAEQGEKMVSIVRRTATRFIKATVRDMDHIGTYDENSYALLLPTASIVDSNLVAERLRKSIDGCELDIAGKKVKFTVSLGVTELKKGDGRESLMQRAERVAAKASQAEGNRVCTDEPESDPSTATANAGEA